MKPQTHRVKIYGIPKETVEFLHSHKSFTEDLSWLKTSDGWECDKQVATEEDLAELNSIIKKVVDVQIEWWICAIREDKMMSVYFSCQKIA